MNEKGLGLVKVCLVSTINKPSFSPTFILRLRELCPIVTTDKPLQLGKEKLLMSHYIHHQLSTQMGIGEFHGAVDSTSESCKLACTALLNLEGEPPPVQL